MKKGQGLSINTIIIVLLALVVLIVIIAIFTGKLGDFVTGTVDCEETYKGRCELQSDTCRASETKRSSGKCFDDDGKVLTNAICCVPLGPEEASTE